MIDAIKYIEKIALVIIIFATVIAIGYEIFAMYEKSLVELADLLLLFMKSNNKSANSTSDFSYIAKIS